MKLPFIERVYHILNRYLPQGTEVWPPGTLHINPFHYLKCGESRRGINRSSHKKYSLWSPPSWRSSATSPGGPQEGLQPPVQARGGHWYQGQFYMIKAESIPNYTIRSSFIMLLLFLSFLLSPFLFSSKTGVNTPRTLLALPWRMLPTNGFH